MAGNGWPVTNLEDGDLQSYLSLRDSIHVFEWAALKLYMSGATTEVREARAATIHEFVKDFQSRNGIGEGCPPGFHPTADGRCVPDNIN
jgi:hypothetical protein